MYEYADTDGNKKRKRKKKEEALHKAQTKGWEALHLSESWVCFISSWPIIVV
jgi:hypothetical protein